MRRFRESFGAKLLAALVGTVGVLLAVTLLVVRSQTERQVAAVAEKAVRSAEAQFAEIEELRRQLVDRLARPLVESPRATASLDAAIMDGDLAAIAGSTAYEMDLAGFPDMLVAYTDRDGRLVLTTDMSGSVSTADMLVIEPVARALLETDDFETVSYRVMEGSLYSVRTRVVELGARLVGTVSFAIPLTDEDVAGIGEVVGVEVCLVAEGNCLAGTASARERLADVLASVAAVTEPLRAVAEGIDWSVSARPLIPGDPAQGARVIAVPLDDVLAPFDRITDALFLGGGGALFLSILIGLALSRSLTRPVKALVAATGRVAEGDYEAEVSVDSHDEIGTLAGAFNEMTRGLLLKERYRSVLNKVVSRDVADELMAGDVELGGENREVTVLFADIRGFTALTDGMEPQEVIGLLNECMERLSRAVEDEGGVVDKYVGDELMAIFGAPISQGDEALRAVRAALRMRAAVEDLNRERARRGEEPIGLGVGLSTGVAVAGNMGSRTRLNYTVLGDIVNLGSRLCSVAGPGEVLISERTRAEIGPAVRVESRGSRPFKGFDAEVEVFAVEGLSEEGLSEEARADKGRTPPPGGAAALGLLLAAALVAAPPGAGAQEWPTLSDAGLSYMSADGSRQLDLSGQIDLETFAFTGHNAGLAYGRDVFVAPRLRLFTDVFLGERVYAFVELRADRGEAPSDTLWDARLEQAFVRVSNRAGTLSLQAGRFASPFGSYAARHLTQVDAFVRPPLAYDYRTVLSRTIAPPDADRFLGWKDQGRKFRAAGAPPVWGVPYQWGAMLSGEGGPLQYRFAVMNSAPSSEVAAWGWDADRFEHPSFVAGVSVELSAEWSVGASWNRGPYAEKELTAGKPTKDHTAYDQELFSVDARFARGPLIARAEVIRDRWEVPNVADDPVEWSYSAEGQLDVSAGLFLSARVGYLDFRRLSDDLGAASSRPGGGAEWDHDVARFEIGAGYRLARNAGLLGSFMHSETLRQPDPNDDLFGLRLWWAF
jgi:class 3 adenylate cyclase